MVVGIYANLDRDLDCVKSGEIVKLFESRGIKCVISDNAVDYFNGKCLQISEVAAIADIMIVFGGDGTMLQVASSIIDSGTPILGVNMGNLGFLTESEQHDLSKIVDIIISGSYEIEERMVLRADVQGNEYIAINEVSIARSRTEHTIDIEIFVDGGLADVVTGDGVIVCTPTGSTAYAMSCGGAILSPDLKAMQITAICPHSLHSRPIVVGDASVVKLNVQRAKLNTVSVIVDGKRCECVADSVTVRRSDKLFRLVRIDEDNFYNKLIKKMNGWNNLDRRVD